MPPPEKTIVILVSGRGSNMQSILQANLPCHIARVITNRADAGALDIARKHGIPTSVLEHDKYSSRTEFDKALAEEIDQHQPHLVVLAGFMRILTPAFVAHYAGRLINIHPSLLPAYSGLNTHERALADGVKIHGCTVHYVTSEVDIGPIIIQAGVPVLADDTPETLSQRVLHEEHRIFPQAIRWILNGNIALIKGHQVIFNHLEQPPPPMISPALD